LLYIDEITSSPRRRLSVSPVGSLDSYEDENESKSFPASLKRTISNDADSQQKEDSSLMSESEDNQSKFEKDINEIEKENNKLESRPKRKSKNSSLKKKTQTTSRTRYNYSTQNSTKSNSSTILINGKRYYSK
jgi:predicted nuclease with TOPRIM domain